MLDRYPFGAVDGKVSSVQLALRTPPVIFARLGPTTEGQPPFCWAPFDPVKNRRERSFSHVGHPACFDFKWQVMPPQPDVGDLGQVHAA